MDEKKNVLIVNPPGKKYLRGEDRCQACVDESIATSLRAPNDLGYIAALCRDNNFVPFVRDYPAENGSESDFIADCDKIKPVILIMSITTDTFKDDIYYFQKAKEINQNIVTLAKGAFFFSCEPSVLDEIGMSVLCLDIAVYSETESVLPLMFECWGGRKNIQNVNGVIYYDRDKKRFIKNVPCAYRDDLDSIPFPARDLMKNELYVRPDTGRPLATIMTSRGCPYSCIYCLSPVLFGKKVRKRSVQSIIEEIKECIDQYRIRDFYFMSDTFTCDKEWVLKLCCEIKVQHLAITWVANSRVELLDEDLLMRMKEAGCWLIALGIESGSNMSLEKMKKGVTKQDAVRAVTMIKRVGLKIYGFYLIGLPWENHSEVKETIEFAKRLQCDFSEVHIAAPYQGTEYYSMLEEYGIRVSASFGFNYFNNPVVGTKYITRDELMKYRKKAIIALHINFRYIFCKLIRMKSFIEFQNYVRYAFRLACNLLR